VADEGVQISSAFADPTNADRSRKERERIAHLAKTPKKYGTHMERFARPAPAAPETDDWGPIDRLEIGNEGDDG